LPVPPDAFKGQVILVTGGSRGIGRATAAAFGRAGGQVAITYRSQKADADAVVQAIVDGGGEALALQADITESAAPAAIVEAVVKRWGRLDVLVNNAGITRDTLVMRMSEGDWDDVIKTNLRGPFLTSKAALRPMLKQRYGRIVNVSSLAGVAGNAGQANYSAAKAGLIGFTRALAKEVGSRNITVNAVAPGFITTDLTKDLPAELLERARQAAAIQRLGTPEDVAPAIVFLASKEASYITGQVLGIDGGLPI
jgi:3-oxoacyl-[acyl-carrier protein] reductase